MYAGLSYASGDYVTIMDADLQDPPRLLPEMMHYIKEEGYDSVATRRVTRKVSQRSGHFCKEILSFDQENFRYGNCRWSQRLSIDDASVCKQSSGVGRIQ